MSEIKTELNLTYCPDCGEGLEYNDPHMICPECGIVNIQFWTSDWEENE